MVDTVKPVTTLAAATVTKVCNAFKEAFAAARNGGSAIAEFCVMASKVLPVTPNEADVEMLADETAKVCGWLTGGEGGTPMKRLKTYKSEARAIFRQAHILPQAINELRAATGSCDYHGAVKLARLIKEHGNAGDAVKAATEAKAAAKSDPMKRLTAVLRTYRNAVNDGKRKNKLELLAAVDTFANAVGIKLT